MIYIACMSLYNYFHTYMPYHTIPYHTIPYHYIPYHYITLHYITLHYITYNNKKKIKICIFQC